MQSMHGRNQLEFAVLRVSVMCYEIAVRGEESILSVFRLPAAVACGVYVNTLMM